MTKKEYRQIKDLADTLSDARANSVTDNTSLIMCFEDALYSLRAGYDKDFLEAMVEIKSKVKKLIIDR